MTDIKYEVDLFKGVQVPELGLKLLSIDITSDSVSIRLNTEIGPLIGV